MHFLSIYLKIKVNKQTLMGLTIWLSIVFHTVVSQLPWKANEQDIEAKVFS